MSIPGVIRLIQQIESDTTLSGKMDFLSQGLRDNPIFGEVLQYALDPYKKFGLKQLPAFVAQKPEHPEWPIWKQVLDNLATRTFTGFDARDHVAAFLRVLTPTERMLFSRILLKDLRCGIGATVVNKVKPGLIPEFGVMLATPIEEKHLKLLNQQKDIYFQAKKNGDRCVVIVTPDGANAYSRKGHEQLNYKHITDYLFHFCQGRERSYVFDGEVILRDFWETRSVKKKAGNNADDAVLHVFDVVPLEDWELGHTAPYGERRATLRRLSHDWAEDAPVTRVVSSKITLAKEGPLTWQDLEDWRDAFRDQGEEGLIIRLDQPYNFKTRSSLFKFKKMIEGDFVIEEIREGEAGKKYEGMAAKVLVNLGELSPGETCEVGLEGDVAFRKLLWKHRNRYVGMTCEVHYQELTENKDKTHKLQFGVMKKIREDKS